MQPSKQGFTTRQYMVTPDFEFFHYKDESTMDIEYHNHDFFEVYMPISGKITYIVEGKTYKLKPGDIILVNNKELHKPLIELGEVYERIVIWVNPDFIRRQSDENTNLCTCFESSSKRRHNLIRPNSDMFNLIRNVVSKLEKVCGHASYGYNILKNIYLTELLVFLNRTLMDNYDEEVEVDIEYNEKINNIIQYINENLSEDLSLDTISTKFFLSKYHLLREFRKYVGHSIHQFIQKKRLILAKSLLKEGMQVTEVFMRCGFGDYSNFIRSFKKTYGTSPKKYYRVYKEG